MKKFSERSFNILISRVLRYGVIFFVVFSLLSFIMRFLNIPHSSDMLRLAIFVLIITPVLRIMMLLYGFIRLKDFKFAVYSLIILIALCIEVIV
jgi:uncharacterized membrane protein